VLVTADTLTLGPVYTLTENLTSIVPVPMTITDNVIVPATQTIETVSLFIPP